MRVELRAGQVHISGYVNATEKKSKPVITPRGVVVEEIEPQAFARAIERADNIVLTLDHDPSQVYAQTADGTLTLYEDSIGLHADATIEDERLAQLARQGRLRGWSFGMQNVVDELVQREKELPIRRIKAMELDHITLVLNKRPVYSAMSLELRSSEQVQVETRAALKNVQIAEMQPQFDNSAFRNRVDAAKPKRRNAYEES